MVDVVYEPAVYVVGRQQVDGADLRRFLADQGAPDWRTDTGVPAEELCEVAGRLCYDSYGNPRPGGNGAYLDNILASGHGSVLEHAVWSLIFTGISRSLSHELVRHRVGLSPSQLSQRYVDESACRFVVPPDLADEVRLAVAYRAWSGRRAEPATPEDFWDSQACLATCPWGSFDAFSAALDAGVDWLDSAEYDLAKYVQLTDYLLRKAPESLSKTDRRKWARQAARSVLPNACETKIFLTGNARAWRHFVELRGSPHADREIRGLAVRAYLRLKGESPRLFSDYDLVDLPDGSRGVVGRHPKV